MRDNMNRLFVMSLIIVIMSTGCVHNRAKRSTVGVCSPLTTTPINPNEGPCTDNRLREPNAERMMQLLELNRMIGGAGTYQ
jgi:hypothetical protein